MKVSIIIVNYNYGRYLDRTIRSCLGQTYENVQVVVVDDGSTDRSRSVISRYGDAIDTVLQDNQGQIGASNAGLRQARGEVVIFLDADDYLFENAVERVVEVWQAETAKVHFRLEVVDDAGSSHGTSPARRFELSSGAVWKQILRSGSYVTPPMSGNAFAREALEVLFPLPEIHLTDRGSFYDRIPPDAYLKRKIPFLGTVQAVQEPLGAYRVHGKNHGASNSPYTTRSKRQRYLRTALHDSTFIAKAAERKGFKWSEDALFCNMELLKLRLLSYRLDGCEHPWKNDTLVGLLKKGMHNLRIGTHYSQLRMLHGLCWMVAASAMPKRTLRWFMAAEEQMKGFLKQHVRFFAS